MGIWKIAGKLAVEIGSFSEKVKVMTDLQSVDTVTIEQRLDELTDQARMACGEIGSASSECAAAWDAVEEVQAEISHRKFLAKSEFERFCEERPEAAECRIYDV